MWPVSKHVRQLGVVLATGGVIAVVKSYYSDSTDAKLLIMFSAVAIPLGLGLALAHQWARVVGLVVFGLLASWNVYLLIVRGFSPFKLVVLVSSTFAFVLLLRWRHVPMPGEPAPHIPMDWAHPDMPDDATD